MLKDLSQAQQILWAVNTVAGVFLLVLIAVRKHYRAYPAFSLYVLLNLVLGVLIFLVYRRWGFFSNLSWLISWGMQALVLCVRGLAVMEVCKHLLSHYRGVWALAWRILLGCASLVLLYAGLAARHGLRFVLPKAERALELAIAAVIVGVFVFLRYYDVEAKREDRSLALGFCLYSCFGVLNNTVLERILDSYVSLWNSLGMLAFLASMLLWTWALRKPQTERSLRTLLPAVVYQTLAPQFNLRLRLLNEQLAQFWKTEATRN
ncbi:MAG TPA: hypothetical protein VEW05_07060 [Candidatus Polarisedimenticolia bacterium]|nr:hypothetical protein [Candidatus Polarisedimenticolia bacterium]